MKWSYGKEMAGERMCAVRRGDAVMVEAAGMGVALRIESICIEFLRCVVFVLSRSGRLMTRSRIGLWRSDIGERMAILDCLPSVPMLGPNKGDRS